jgi:hypothetical protein
MVNPRDAPKQENPLPPHNAILSDRDGMPKGDDWPIPAISPYASPDPTGSPGFPVAAAVAPANVAPAPPTEPGGPVQSWLIPQPAP